MKKKKAIKVSQILEALNKEMPVSQLMQEFDITRKQFQTVLEIMRNKGFISQARHDQLHCETELFSNFATHNSVAPQTFSNDQSINYQIEMALDRLFGAGGTK